MTQQDKVTQPRIFVQLAVYRDALAAATVAECFANATHPERITVGICWQAKAEDAPLALPEKYESQIRITSVDALQSKGVCWSRAQTQALWEGEEFTLQIDSRMHFAKGWDEALIAFWQSLDDPNAVITTYAAQAEEEPINRTIGGHFDEARMFVMSAKPLHARESQSPLQNAFCAAGFHFGPGTMIARVPYDPHLYYLGEEATRTVRLWTNGYNFYLPPKNLVWYAQHETPAPRHFDEYADWQKLNDTAYLRAKHLLGTEPTRDKDALQDIEKFGLGTARTLDRYQTFSGVDFRRRTIAPFAREGYFGTRDDIRRIEATKHERIYVLIASYRDPECQWTVKDLFDKAAHPERITVGICWQFDKVEDTHCFVIPYPRPEQVRVMEVDWRDSEGVCWARWHTQRMWDGEEYCLQLDAHMRFLHGWDEELILELARCDSDNARAGRAMLSTDPEGYKPPYELDPKQLVTVRRAGQFDQNGNIRCSGESLHIAPPKPLNGAFIIGNFMFSRSHYLQEVPYDPYLAFDQEEIIYSARLWTHGWDMFSSTRHALFHQYNDGKESVRPLHWTDLNVAHLERSRFLYDRGLARMNHLTGYKLSDDPEVIKEMNDYGFGTIRSFEDYMAYSGVDFLKKVATDRALHSQFVENIQAYRAPSQPASVTPPPVAPVTPAQAQKNPNAPQMLASSKKERIFVQIAAYRDRECQWTVKDIFEKAAYPDRVTIGICWQVDEARDADCFTVPYVRPNQVREIRVDWRESDGVCWARAKTQSLWQGEEFTLQIDAHTRFVPAWDELMIRELARCSSDKAVLSCNPASYTPPNNLDAQPRAAVRRAQPFDENGNLRGRGEFLAREPQNPLPAAFIAGGFVFASSQIITQVPYDPYLYFDQEEMMYAARLYTHGWDIFSARKQFLFHYYNSDGEASVRPLHWKDLKEENPDRGRFLWQRGLDRFNHLTDFEMTTDANALAEIDRFGYGMMRTLQQYETFSGVDFKRKQVSIRALQCEFIPDLRRYRDQPFAVEAVIPFRKKAQEAVKNEVKVTAPIRMLQAGEAMDLFVLPNQHGVNRAIELLAGKPVVILLYPAKNQDDFKNYLTALKKAKLPSSGEDHWAITVLNQPADVVKTWLGEGTDEIEEALCDPQLTLFRALGALDEAGVPVPLAYVCDRGLRVHSLCIASEMKKIIPQAKRSLEEYLAVPTAAPQVIKRQSPALIIPRALDAVMVQQLLIGFESGEKEEGLVGSATGETVYRPNAKIRRDWIVSEQLMREVDAQLSRRVIAELERVYGFEVTHREPYKVGCYSAEQGGFFTQHRDNFEAPLGYRRIALTLHLNEDYEGGGLNFPEYGADIIKPATADAVFFPCGLMHQALRVTKGKRFVLVGFFHGAQDEAYREWHIRNHQPNRTYNAEEFRFHRAVQHALPRSRDFYMNALAQTGEAPFASKQLNNVLPFSKKK